MKLVRKLFVCWAVAIMGITASFANNLQINNVQVGSNHTISFDISWENSWALDMVSKQGNHDAVWIFIKYKNDNGNWQHLGLSSDNASHQSDSLAIETVADGKGVFLKGKNPGAVNINTSKVTLNWTDKYLSGNYDFKVFGIEMTWVPEGSFYVGDGVSYYGLTRGDKKSPFRIESENAIKTGKDSLSLIDTGKSAPAGDIPESFPKGYNGFYCMKYETTQQQYIDFLNCLNYTQQKNHVTTSPDAASGSFAFGTARVNRNGIIIQNSGKAAAAPAVFACDAFADNLVNNANDGQNRACNFLNWNDLAAYLQWAALRPMTELEFEKTCRGPLKPVAQEFAWGTPYTLDANTTINEGTANETVKENPGTDTGLASFGYAGLQGPLRAGFAANLKSDRLKAGAGYYGNMEMSGNLWEMCIVLSKEGLNYAGIPGDGNLPNDGFANMQGWPKTDCLGGGQRGGGWNSGVVGPFRDLAVSDRFYITLAPTDRRNTSGGRGVR
jgi:formylglycine-generating enzyme required for sulfatase activity